MRRLPGLSIYLSLLSIFTVPSSHSVQEKKPVAYVITAASNASQKGREPTWIGLMSGSRTLHIPANESIIEVSPGSYRLHHFDFGKSRSSGHGTLHVNSRIKKMKISPSTIYFIGRFEVSKRRVLLGILWVEVEFSTVEQN